MSSISEAQSPKKILNKLIQEGKKQSLHLERLPVRGYEQVIKVTDPSVGLTAIIAIHDTTLGPALGGIRIQMYKSFQEALEDALRLAKGMTYKSAMAEVGFGGGKSVIIADPKKHKTPELLHAFGAAVDQLNGAYICAEDMGCSSEDCAKIRKVTQYVVGLPHERSSGDPGPFTAWGVFRGIETTAKKLFGAGLLEGKTVAVQGLGNVGSNLVPHLFWAGANLILADLDFEKAQRLAEKYGAKVVSSDEILSVECDILAPCARGAIINDHTIPLLRCKAIAGGANNQLLRDTHAAILKDRGILYAPDFVINAGGLHNVAAELEEGGYCPTSPRTKINRISDSLTAIYEIADRNNDSTQEAALALADYRIKYGIGKRVTPPRFYEEKKA